MPWPSIPLPLPLPFLLLFLLLPPTCLGTRPSKAGHICLFPEAQERQFFFDVRSDSAPRSIILDTVVEPADARLALANMRSNNLPEELDVNSWLSLEKRANGQFLVFTADEPIGLPTYPSGVNESLLYVTVRCNGRLYPLMTIRLRATNAHAPEWIGPAPFEVAIPKNAQAGALFATPLLALDQEPASTFPITFAVEPPHDRDFGLVLADRAASLSVAEQVHLLSTLPAPFSKRLEDWRQQQLPPIVQLRVLNTKMLLLAKSFHFLNISATDNGVPEARRSWTQLKVAVKDQREAAARFQRLEYFGNFTKKMRPGDELLPAEPMLAVFPSQRAGDRILYELDRANPYSQLFQMDPETGRMRLAQPLPEGIPQTVELDVLARLQLKGGGEDSSAPAPSGPVARAKLALTDQTEVRLTYFAQCHYEAHLAENPSAYTRVLQFNFKGDVEGVELLNGTELFKVDQYGQMTVRPDVDIDRERTDRIVVKARLRSKAALHPKSLELCQIATADILIDDVNDHSPRFTRRSYRFRIEPNPFNNTEVGSLRAVDGDRAEFGRIRYRLLEEFVIDGQGGEEPLPFVLFQGDGTATLFFVIRPLHLQLRQPYKPQAEYTFTVEAYDLEEDPRTARVMVNVRLEDAPSKDAMAREMAAEQQQQEEEEEQLLEETPTARDQPADESRDVEEVGGGHFGLSQSQRRSLPEGQPAKALAARAKHLLDKDSPIRGAEKMPLALSQGQEQVRFAQEQFIFRMRGTLRQGQTIGRVQAKQQMPGEGEAEEQPQPPLEYAVEEGIAGFVGVEPASGRLFVGPHLVGDKFEEIRFTVAAQDPRDGRVWATALVSVLIDEATLGQPFFDQSTFHFNLDLSQEPPQGRPWPRMLGQVEAKTTGSNGSTFPGDLVYSLTGTRPEGLFAVDPKSGWLRAERAPGQGEWPEGAPVEFGVRACLRQNTSNCAEARVQVDLVELKAPTMMAQPQNDSSGEEEGSSTEKPVEFEQFRYELDLSERQFLPEGSRLVQLRLRQPMPGISYRLVPGGEGREGFGLEEAGKISQEDLEIDSQNGELQVRHDLRLSPAGPVQSQQFTVQAVQSERVLASSVLLIRQRAKAGQLPKEEGEEGGTPQLQFIPLPKMVFLAPSKPVGSTILRVSVRVLDPKDGSWHLLPLAAFQAGDGQPMQVDYSVQGGAPGQFSMRDNLLQLDQPLRPGTLNLTLRARLQRRRPMGSDEPAREEIHAILVEHPLRIVVMAEDGRQRFPVFERISYEFQVDPTAHFPVTFPPLNASLAGGQQIQFSIWPARSEDPTDGLEMHPQTGQLRVHQHFLDNFPAEKGGEVFLVVRAVNQAAPEQSFSDASIALIVRPKSVPPLQFQMPLFRFVLGEDLKEGSIVNGGASIGLANAASHPNARIRLEGGGQWAGHFSLLPNGSLLLNSPVDLERMEDGTGGIIRMEAIAEEGQNSIRAPVEVQLQDKDEHVPDFVPLFPEFRLQLPITAGQPIGRLLTKDEDFTDRQEGGTALGFRAISGNASRLVHVQRDGLLLVKDPNAEMGTYSLLVEVRDHNGLIARTSAKFVLEGEEEEEGRRRKPGLGVLGNGGADKEGVEEKGTTVDVPLASPSNAGQPKMPLFSVRDSLTWRQDQPPQVHFKLEENPDNLFRLDPSTGELFLAEEAAFGTAQRPREEYELRMRIEQDGDGKLMARRVYTVRLVPAGERKEGQKEEEGTTPMNAGIEEEGEQELQEGGLSTAVREEEVTPNNPAVTEAVTRASTERRTRWTLRQTTFDQAEQQQTSVPRVEIEEGESTPEPLSSTVQAQTSRRIRPSARPLTRVQLSTGTSQEGQRFSSPSAIATTPASVPASSPPAHLPLHFALSRYHWVVANPQRETLVGRLELEGGEAADQQPPMEIQIEPAQFRQWFRADSKSGELYLREVPSGLFGKQRAEFRVHLANLNNAGQLDDADVTVDLQLAPNPAISTTPSSTTLAHFTAEIGEGDTTTLTTSSPSSSSVEIAESSDQQTGPLRRPPSAVHGTTLTAIDTRFTVSISPMRFTAETADSNEDEEEAIGRTNGLTLGQGSSSRWTASTGDQEEEESSGTSTRAGPADQSVGSGSAEAGLRFGAEQFKAMLPEGRYGNSGAQLSLRPHALAQGMPAGVQFSIEQADNEDPSGQPLPFFVHRESGELVAFAEIDREERAQYQFRVKAFDPSTGQSALTQVTVQILDVNDNFPQFLEPLVRAIPLGRLTPAGTRLAKFVAVDPDEGAHGRVQFHMEEDPSGGWFRLDQSSGELVLARAVPGEEEDKRDMFELILSALDGGRPALRTEHHVRVEVFPDSGLSGPEFRRTVYDAGKVAAGAAQNGTFVWQVTAGPSEQIKYALIDPPIAHLFVIDPESGQIRMGRRPLDTERGRQWTLNVSATEGQGPRAQHAFTAVNVYLEHLPVELEPAKGSSTSKPSATEAGAQKCQFSEKIYHGELAEHTEGRQRLTTLKTVGCEGRRVQFTMEQGNDAFELDNKSGELFAIAPLDREKKSLYFLVVNISSVQSGVATVNELELSQSQEEEGEGKRTRRRARDSREQASPSAGTRTRGREVLFNGLVEQAKAKLAENQALVLIRVLDRNDNPPQFQQLTSDDQIVFSVDWQAPVLQPIGRVQAHDPDEHVRLQFSLEGDEDGVFAINASSGVLQLMKSLQNEPKDEFKLTVVVGDGEHVVRAPLMVYKLQPGTNIALLVINQPVEKVDVLRAIRHLNMLLAGLEVEVLIKQVYIGEDGLADPRRTHLLVYALDKKSRVPIPATRLKELLEGVIPQLNDTSNASSGPSIVPESPLRHLADVYVPDYAGMNTPFRLTSAEITLLAVSILLVFCVCSMLFVLLRCCKRRQELISKSDLEYMVDSQVAGAGPRPYNVELITRKAAQAAQAANRRILEPVEECTMTPESRATMVASSGIYGPGGGSQLGGPLRRTARAQSTSADESSPPLHLSADQSLLLRPQRGRAGQQRGTKENAAAVSAGDKLNKGYENGTEDRSTTMPSSSAENSPEVGQRAGGAGGREAPKSEPPPPPTSSPPQMRQAQQQQQERTVA